MRMFAVEDGQACKRQQDYGHLKVIENEKISYFNVFHCGISDGCCRG